jgi:hypothetical protein
MSVNIFNNLPEFLVDSVGDKNQFTGKRKEILVCNSFYSFDEFLIIVKIYN